MLTDNKILIMHAECKLFAIFSYALQLKKNTFFFCFIRVSEIYCVHKLNVNL